MTWIRLGTQSRALAACAGVLVGCFGCGGPQEGIPSNIDPNKPSAQVKGMLEAAKQVKPLPAGKGQRKGAGPADGSTPKSLSKGSLKPAE